MDKPTSVKALEKYIRVTGHIFGAEKVTEEVQEAVHWIQENFGAEQRTRLGKRFVDSAMTDLVDPIVGAFVHHTLDSAKEH